LKGFVFCFKRKYNNKKRLGIIGSSWWQIIHKPNLKPRLYWFVLGLLVRLGIIEILEARNFIVSSFARLFSCFTILV